MVKYLVVRFSSIGDIVLTTPIVRCLKKQVDGAEVHFLTKAAYASLVTSNPYIDKVYTLGNSFAEILDELKAEEYDYIIDLHKNLRTTRLRRALKRVSFSFDKLNFEKWLAVRLKYNRLPNLHIVDRYFEAVELFDVINDREGLDFFPKDPDWQPEENYAVVRDKYAVLVLGAKHATKQMPLALIQELCRGVQAKLLLVGGKAEMGIADQVSADNQQCINLVGKLSIDESAQIIAKSAVVITPDTGMMHIAAAYKRNILSVWGNTLPEFGMYPYLPGEYSKIFEVEGLTCRPCSKIGYRSCPKKHFRCMKDQNSAAIIADANRIISLYE